MGARASRFRSEHRGGEGEREGARGWDEKNRGSVLSVCPCASLRCVRAPRFGSFKVAGDPLEVWLLAT